jgi:hypothetical protein
MPNSTNSKFKNFIGNVFEPVALVLLVLLFIIPTLTILNLSPITKAAPTSNVLGVNTSATVLVTLVGGEHKVITNEQLTKSSDSSYSYTSTLGIRGIGTYSKPILQIQNNTESSQKITFYGGISELTSSTIYLVVNNQKYQIRDENGQTYTQEITVNPSKSIEIGLSIVNSDPINFTENFNLNIAVQ